MDYAVFSNRHHGATAFIVGSGPSVYGLDLTPIHKAIVLTVNAGILLMPWQTGYSDRRYWVANDEACRSWSYWPVVQAAKARKIVRSSWGMDAEDFYSFEPRELPRQGIDPKARGLLHCSSIPTAIDLALQLGCKRLFLVGVDQYAQGGITHFWQRWDRSLQPTAPAEVLPVWERQQAAFAYNVRAYRNLRAFADSLGAQIINCNLRSKVREFQMMTFEEALQLAESPTSR